MGKIFKIKVSFTPNHQSIKLNARKSAKTISTFDFSTLYTTIPYNFFIELLSKIIKFYVSPKPTLE